MIRFAKPSDANLHATSARARYLRSITLLRWQAKRRPWLALYIVNRHRGGLAGEADVVSMCELLDVAEHRDYKLVLCRVLQPGGKRWAVYFGVPKVGVQ